MLQEGSWNVPSEPRGTCGALGEDRAEAGAAARAGVGVGVRGDAAAAEDGAEAAGVVALCVACPVHKVHLEVRRPAAAAAASVDALARPEALA